jgi:hypothetical protein
MVDMMSELIEGISEKVDESFNEQHHRNETLAAMFNDSR